MRIDNNKVQWLANLMALQRKAMQLRNVADLLENFCADNSPQWDIKGTRVIKELEPMNVCYKASHMVGKIKDFADEMAVISERLERGAATIGSERGAYTL